MDQDDPPVLRPVDRPLDLIPVGLKEAALDSPTFRATAHHFADQVEHVERWLDGYIRAGTKLSQDILLLENSISSWLQQTCPPSQISEAVLDHDYATLATKRYADAAREFWQATFKSIKKSEKNVIEPIRAFMNNDLRNFREARRNLDTAQRNFDSVLSRYASQPKTKEASSLREDAFQVHEARKAYLKASLDFCVQGPNVRAALDKLIVRIFSDQWRDWKASREMSLPTLNKWAAEMERIRGWGREMENSERAFKRELVLARKQIEDNAEQAVRPPRELDDYAEKTAPFLGSTTSANQRPEKQGWLYVKSVTGKPAKTVWTRRWFFVKNGIFGWLVQGVRSGGVEESERIGLLLCSIRPALQEERRFCFELKTKDTGIVLQAESQNELSHWIDAFDLAKRKALEDPGSTESTTTASNTDAAFAISPPVAPEFAAKADAHLPHSSDDQANGLLAPDMNGHQLGTRSSFDVSSPRKVTGFEKEAETRDTPRIIQKLDLHRKSTPSAQMNPSGGIASLISSSHSVLPLGPVAPPPIIPSMKSSPMLMASSSLAPSSLANPPAPTNLSKTAVVVSGERGIRIGQSDGSGMPGGIMANMWGSEKWGAVNRLERDGSRTPKRIQSAAASPEIPQVPLKATDDVGIMDGMSEVQKEFGLAHQPAVASPLRIVHRKTMSVTPGNVDSATPWDDGFPTNYPLALRAQDAQFRVLFPDVPIAEKVVLVFRATWNPSEEQEFPGRVFLTTQEIYFYSHHLGFVLISGVSMETITEVTAAPGKDCDFLFVHMKDQSRPDDLRRVTIKTFLEPLRVLQKRVNYLIQNANSETPASLEEVIRTLLRMETAEPVASADNESLDDLAFSGEEDDKRQQRLPKPREHDIKPSLRIDGNLYGDPIARTGRDVTRFKLPAQPVLYTPPGVGDAVLVKDFSASAKALFHVIFGDKSAVFQQLYRNRGADEVTQSSWIHSDEAHSKRTFNCKLTFGTITDSQTIDVQNDHLCYVVTSTKVLVNYPMSDRFFFIIKYVITHAAKSQCRLAVFHKIVWAHDTPLKRSKGLIERLARNNLEYEANELVSLAMEQVAKLGPNSNTNKAIHIFGHIGHATQPVHITASDLPAYPGASSKRKMRKYTLFSIYRHEAFRHVYKVLSIIFDVFDALMKFAMSTFSAHTVLVLLLAFSFTFNSWHSYRDSLTWWHERRATKFMARLGVRNNEAISRHIYIHDFEDLLERPTELNITTNVVSSPSARSCRIAFNEILVSHDTGLFEKSARAVRAEKRLHGTRDTLAGYRHDLLVALKVVNKVEKEVIRSAWEEWLLEESMKCKRMTMLLAADGRKSAGARTNGKATTQPLKEISKELDSYCRGCREELTALGIST
ncbi:hypothetical protein K461DRAFT_165751 [Myriangium duriaei CBS 260.36]|uniref:Uncharacterized protein n=1 Tax=Myriangium duriaei CBS 260.36 TaxID=1168546 RepID=A0A9P4IYZ1_9PEZI|nr:hypothetical protein K461DRAFT_165751 [Myriangium duriaei CBS 260.36]